MAKNHMFRSTSYVGVGATMRCNMTRSITWVDAEGHRACLDNTWLAPEFASHSNRMTQAQEQVQVDDNVPERGQTNLLGGHH